MWPKSIITVVFLSLLSPGLLPAQWAISAKNRLSQHANTEIFLAYIGQNQVDKEFLINLSIRPEGKPNAYLQKELTLTTDQSQSFTIPVQLPPGGYDIDVDIWDKKPNTWQLLSLPEPYQVNRRRRLLLSDIFLANTEDVKMAFSRPYMGQELDTKEDFLHYFLELYAPNLNQATVRAILYQQDRSQQRQENSTASFYVSLYQAEKILNTAGQEMVLFQDAIDLADLAEGEYLIHTLVYEGKDLVGEEKTWFTLGGGVLERVYAHLDQSIRMMEYIAPVERLEYLLALPEEIAKKAEFQKTWKTLYSTNTADNMEAYFRRVFEAESQFGTPEKPGWQSDMGRIYILYGNPRKKDLDITGIPHVRWTYAEWGLSFLFEKHNQGFVLVE